MVPTDGYAYVSALGGLHSLVVLVPRLPPLCVRFDIDSLNIIDIYLFHLVNI